MNKILNLFMSLAVLALIFSACTPEEMELGEADVSSGELVEGSAFAIEHDAENPNIVYLKSLLDSRYKPLWNHPQGRSQEQTVTLKIAFPGTYDVQFGVMTRGGLVYSDTASFEIADFYAEFVSDPLWEALTNGPGNEKSWHLDIDAKYFDGPMYFYGTENGWQGECLVEGGDCWNWSPAYNPETGENDWLMSDGDYGTMTFSLDGGAFYYATKPMDGGIEEEGTFLLDADAKTLTINDASILRGYKTPDNRGIPGISNWTNYRVFSLDENTMQLGVIRDQDVDGEGPAMLVYNFISKEYSDNWVPGEPEPPYDGDANSDLTTTTTKKWVLSLTTPYNWANLDGSLKNEWEDPEDYDEYDATLIGNVSLTMVKSEGAEDEGSYTFTDGGGNEITGAYEIDDQNNIVFDQSISFPISGSIELATTDENMLRVISTEKDDFDVTTGIWLGQRQDDQYIVYHFELASSASDPIEEARKAIIKAITGSGSRSFKISDTWPVDFGDANYEGGWTSVSYFAEFNDDNSWLWTEEVKTSIEDPRLTFSVDGEGNVTCTKSQDGVETSADVEIDAENLTLTIDIDLIEFGGAASWLPVSGPTWKIVRTNLNQVDSEGMWLGRPHHDNPETESIWYHYVVADE